MQFGRSLPVGLEVVPPAAVMQVEFEGVRSQAFRHDGCGGRHRRIGGDPPRRRRIAAAPAHRLAERFAHLRESLGQRLDCGAQRLLDHLGRIAAEGRLQRGGQVDAATRIMRTNHEDEALLGAVAADQPGRHQHAVLARLGRQHLDRDHAWWGVRATRQAFSAVGMHLDQGRGGIAGSARCHEAHDAAAGAGIEAVGAGDC